MVIACLVVLGTTAGCALGEDDQTSTEATQCVSTPRPFMRQAWAFSGEVQDVAVRCETIYVAGGGSIGRRTGPLALVSAASGARRGLAAELTGAVDDTSLAEAPVEAVVDDGHGGWYVGGSFAFVDETHCPGLTHVTGRGQVDPKFCPKVDGPVHELARTGNTLYVAGDFSHVAGRPRKTLAAVSTSGLLLPWAPRLEPKLTCPDRDALSWRG